MWRSKSQHYAIFLEEVRGDLDEAERIYGIALESTQDGLLDETETPTPSERGEHDRNTQFSGRSMTSNRPKSLERFEDEVGPQIQRQLQQAPHPKIDLSEPTPLWKQTATPDVQQEHRHSSTMKLTVGSMKVTVGSNELLPRADTGALERGRSRQSPKRESLKENLRNLPQRKIAGSSTGRVDAERRFTDGSYRISDESTAGTRHKKAYTGMSESGKSSHPCTPLPGEFLLWSSGNSIRDFAPTATSHKCG